MQAAENGKADIVSFLLAAGADIEAKNIVSKRISICLAHMCVCVCVLYSSIISYCMISEKCRFILFLYFIIVICRI